MNSRLSGEYRVILGGPHNITDLSLCHLSQACQMVKPHRRAGRFCFKIQFPKWFLLIISQYYFCHKSTAEVCVDFFVVLCFRTRICCHITIHHLCPDSIVFLLITLYLCVHKKLFWQIIFHFRPSRLFRIIRPREERTGATWAAPLRRSLVWSQSRSP